MKDIKNINTVAKEKIEKFINYYNQKIEYLEKSNQISSNRINDFNNWYNGKAVPLFEDVMRLIKPSADQERISSLIDMFIFIMEKSIIDNDYERLIDNLYFLPEKMMASFEKFDLVDKKHVFEDTISLTLPHTDKTFWGYEVNYSYTTGDPNLGSPVLQ